MGKKYDFSHVQKTRISGVKSKTERTANGQWEVDESRAKGSELLEKAEKESYVLEQEVAQLEAQLEAAREKLRAKKAEVKTLEEQSGCWISLTGTEEWETQKDTKSGRTEEGSREHRCLIKL